MSPGRLTWPLGWVLLLPLSAGCTAALDHPPVVVPQQALRKPVDGPEVRRVALISIAAVGSGPMNVPSQVDRDSSRAAAEWLDRALLSTLARRGIEVSRSPRSPAPGYLDSAGFKEAAINPYGGGYHGTFRIPSHYCIDDSLLRGAAARSAWVEVLARLVRLREKARAGEALASAPGLRRALGADVVVLGVLRARDISGVRKAAQATTSALVTLGMVPAYEPSSCHLHVYVIDLERGVFRWADACRVNDGGPLAPARAWAELQARWP